VIQRKTYTLEEAKLRIANYCVYRDRAHKEVREKLKSMGMIPLAIDELLDYLIQENFLNEERYAKSFARGKFKIKSWGRIRISRELKAMEVSDYCIKKALTEINSEDYVNTFNKLSEKKAESLSNYPIQIQKKKLMDYLMYRGWESSMIFDKINELF
jgi:regulatory protein